MSDRRFVHLHTHSEYSEFDGLSTVSRIVAAARDDHQPAVAITDHGSLGSLWALRNECEKTDGAVRPIPGLEAYLVVAGTRHDPGRIEVPRDAEEMGVDAGGFTRSRATGRRTKTKRYEHLTILARTARGLRNLIELSNKAQETRWSAYPMMDYDLLAEHGEGLILLTGCIGGPVAGPLSRITGEDEHSDRSEMDRAQRAIDKMIAAVGRDNVYVEVADHGIQTQEDALPRLYEIADRNGLKVVAANDSHYVDESDKDAQEAWIALGQKGSGKAVTVSTPGRYKFSGSGHFFRTAQQMHEVRPDDERWQQACDETVRLAERVEDGIFHEPKLRVPTFPIPRAFRESDPKLKADSFGSDPMTRAYFQHRIAEGMKQRLDGAEIDEVTRERLNLETSTIRRLGMMDYFLIVDDLVRFARSDYTAEDWIARHDGSGEVDDEHRKRREPIIVGPGRGSAAGSLVSYALGIVNVDPLANGLLFERFLDPERTEMPDIDVDFEKLRREEVIHYLSVRYGHEKVCRLGMHGTTKTKRALDSAGRYLEVPAQKVDALKKTLPDDPPPPLSLMLGPRPVVPYSGSEDEKKEAAGRLELWTSGQAFRDHVDQGGEQLVGLVELATRIENVVTNPGKHACGVVVSDEPLVPLVPMRLHKGEWVTEWDGEDIADVGLLKMDILGLRTLDVVKATSKNAEIEHDDFRFDIMAMETASERAERTWEMLGDGESTGVFQLESEGMRDLLTTARPTNLDDLSALIAAYRPGPMSAGMHTEWAERTGGNHTVSYDALTTDPREQEIIASVLGETNGVILFQEQMMRLGRIIGNFTPAQANRLRRAISKKKQTEINALRPEFIEGAQREGVGEDGSVVPPISEETARRLWVAFEGSGQYAFNKSHTTAYGVLAFQTAYLKANWAAEFGAATLRFTETNKATAAKRISAMASLRREGIEVMAPDINVSGVHTMARDGRVWIGLSEIAGVGSIAESIVAERERAGEYRSMSEMFERTGAAGDRPTTMQLGALAQSGAFDRFGPRMGHLVASRALVKNPGIEIPDIEWGILEKAARQRELIRATVDEHPTLALRSQIEDSVKTGDGGKRRLGTALHKLARQGAGPAHTFGIVSSIAPKTTRRGDIMYTLELENRFTTLKGVGFDRLRRHLDKSGPIYPGDLVEAWGTLQERHYEREVTDEETGEMSTVEVVEHSLVVDRLSVMDVEDPTRDEEPPATLHVGRLLGEFGRPATTAAAPDEPNPSAPRDDDDPEAQDPPEEPGSDVFDDDVDPAPAPEESESPRQQPGSDAPEDCPGTLRRAAGSEQWRRLISIISDRLGAAVEEIALATSPHVPRGDILSGLEVYRDGVEEPSGTDLPEDEDSIVGPLEPPLYLRGEFDEHIVVVDGRHPEKDLDIACEVMSDPSWNPSATGRLRRR